MPKSQYTAEKLYKSVAVRQCISEQDFNAKFAKISQKKRAAFEVLATELNGEPAKPREVKTPSAKKDFTKPAKPKKASSSSDKSASKKKEPVPPSEPKKRKVTGYSVYAQRAREHMKKHEIPVNSVSVKEMKENYKSLKEASRKKYEARAVEINDAL